MPKLTKELRKNYVVTKMCYRQIKNRFGLPCVTRRRLRMKTDTHCAIAVRHNRQYNRTALTLVEMIIAMAIMAIIFAAIVPQFRNIRISWDSKRASAETLQNGRVLIDHLNHNLTKAVKITAVSDDNEPNGFIHFEDS